MLNYKSFGSDFKIPIIICTYIYKDQIQVWICNEIYFFEKKKMIKELF